MTTVTPPKARECEHCGRTDEWNADRGTWTVVFEDGDRLAGDPFCLHEWDINGTYNPLEGGA